MFACVAVGIGLMIAGVIQTKKNKYIQKYESLFRQDK